MYNNTLWDRPLCLYLPMRPCKVHLVFHTVWADPKISIWGLGWCFGHGLTFRARVINSQRTTYEIWRQVIKNFSRFWHLQSLCVWFVGGIGWRQFLLLCEYSWVCRPVCLPGRCRGLCRFLHVATCAIGQYFWPQDSNQNQNSVGCIFLFATYMGQPLTNACQDQCWA